MAPKKVIRKKLDEVPATRGMLHLVRDDLRSEIRSWNYRWEARFKGFDLRFSQVDARFEQVDARFDQFRSETLSIFDQIMSKIHQTHSLIEKTLTQWNHLK